MTFTQEATFIATFMQKADFQEAVFMQDADFFGTTFTQHAYFNNVTFTGRAHFRGATFTGRAHFCGATFTMFANFLGVTFIGPANFWKATLGQDAEYQHAEFSEVTFTQQANFMAATFLGDADFSRATFTRDAMFSGSKFLGTARWLSSRFLDSAEFRHIEFCPGRAGGPNAVFSFASFDKPGQIVFDDVDLGRTLFLNRDVSEVLFTASVRWGQGGDNRKARIFEETIPLGQQDAQGLQINGERDYRAVAQIYQQLKKNYDARLDYWTANEFHFGEMEGSG